jgi:hypothetical protein
MRKAVLATMRLDHCTNRPTGDLHVRNRPL